jgi:hypothetical protein
MLYVETIKVSEKKPLDQEQRIWTPIRVSPGTPFNASKCANPPG